MSTELQGVRRLVTGNPIAKAVVRQFPEHGLPKRARPSSQAFAALASSIISQQLAGKAAETIHGRFVAAIGGLVRPEAVLGTPLDELRGAGLSGAKAASILDLAAHVEDARLHLSDLNEMSDDQIVAELIQVRGIGRWTAEMFMMFHLGRLDVWPTGDLGVRNGFGRMFRMAEPPTAKELEPLGDAFRPHRSVVAWYCWRATELPKDDYAALAAKHS